MTDRSRILLIDDDSIDRKMIKRILNKSACLTDIFEADTAESGLSLIRDNHFDAIFLDYNLPDNDGKSVLKEIIHDDPQATIIILTGNIDEKLSDAMLQEGATDFLIKDEVSDETINRSYFLGRSRLRRSHRFLLQQTEI